MPKGIGGEKKKKEMSEVEDIKNHSSWLEVNMVHTWRLFTFQISFNITVSQAGKTPQLNASSATGDLNLVLKL